MSSLGRGWPCACPGLGQPQGLPVHSSYGYQPYAGVYDAGGIVWEMDKPFTSLDEVLDKMERAIGVWCREQGIELVDRRGRVIPFPED